MNSEEEAHRIFQQGIQQFRVRQCRETLQSWETARRLYRELGDRPPQIFLTKRSPPSNFPKQRSPQPCNAQNPWLTPPTIFIRGRQDLLHDTDVSLLSPVSTTTTMASTLRSAHSQSVALPVASRLAVFDCNEYLNEYSSGCPVTLSESLSRQLN